MFFDLPLEQLQSYLPDRQEPADFDAFWQNSLQELRQFPLEASFTPVEEGLTLVDTFDVSFCGYGGQTIWGWLIVPRERSAPLPCVVEFLGYGGGRGAASEHLFWANAGYAHLVMDTRGQGSGWSSGAGSTGVTADAEAQTHPHYPGYVTRGILTPESYYYRRVFCDAVRAVEAAKTHPAIDPERVAVSGASQGGGISLAVSALTSVAATLPDVPFLCHYPVATAITDKEPYFEITKFCRVHRGKQEAVFRTLNYFDGIHFSARCHAPALFSVALMDDICPPRTVFAAYNHYAGDKNIRIWPYNHHEGGGAAQQLEKLSFLNHLGMGLDGCM